LQRTESTNFSLIVVERTSQYLHFTSWLEDKGTLYRGVHCVVQASASFEHPDRPCLLSVHAELDVSAPSLCLCFNGRGVEVPPGHVLGCRREHILTLGDEERALVAQGRVQAAGRDWREGDGGVAHSRQAPARSARAATSALLCSSPLPLPLLQRTRR
jgi:hypothetical protein